MFKILCESVEAAVRRDTVELLNHTLAQQTSNNSSNNITINNMSISEASIKAAMPEVTVPLVSARLYDDRGNNFTQLKDLKANCYGE